jgi:hypothetical protein
MANQQTAMKIGLAVLALGAGISAGGCADHKGGPLSADVQSIIFLQRMPRTNTGNVFDYTSYIPGGRLVTLTPPSADGKLQVLTSDPMFDGADIMSYDLSFDAKSVVFSAHLANEDHYQIFSMNLDGTNLQKLTDGNYDYVYPIFIPGQRIFFTTNKNVEVGAPQFEDEYERQTTAQVGTMNLAGQDEVLGARNVSHRVSPSLLPNGRVLYTEWRHMGMVNDGHLRMMNSDMTAMREAFGGEDGGNGGTNSYLKARYVQSTTLADGTTNYQLVTVATSRDRTLQAGKLFLVNLNQSEELSSFTDLTPIVPGDREKSDLGVGRYYDAESIGDPNARQFLVSWADGPVETETLAMAMSQANFGLYVYDARDADLRNAVRKPVYDDPKYWDVLARPIKARPEPPAAASPISSDSTIFGALNVYNTSLTPIPAGSVAKVRLIEGFSGEEGIRSFGTTEFDGQSLYGEIVPNADNSFAAKVPGDVPFHIQVIDKFAMSIQNESVWISGRKGEQRFCGGCHENRAQTTQIPSGVADNVLAGAVNMDVPRAQRIGSKTDFSYGKIRGMPWDLAIQPFLTAKCATCHDGDATKPGNPTYTVTDMTTMTSQTFTFDLRGQVLPVVVGEKMTSDFTASYLSLMGLGEILGEDVVQITGDYVGRYGYVVAGSAKDSAVVQKLNPPQQFPSQDESVRYDPTAAIHPLDAGAAAALSPDEYYRLILSIDMGGQFYSRENNPHNTGSN